jgi:hypothetical protein
MLGSMKISEKYPQFNDAPVLVLVTSKQEAALYKAEKGEFDELERFVIERPENTDKEGEFKTRGEGLTVRSGTVYERNDTALIRDFMSEMEKLVTKHLRDTEGTLYFFAPAAVKGHIEKLLRKGPTSKLDIHSYEGNYMHNHTSDLLQMIADDREGKQVVPTAPEAERILNIRQK